MENKISLKELIKDLQDLEQESIGIRDAETGCLWKPCLELVEDCLPEWIFKCINGEQDSDIDWSPILFSGDKKCKQLIKKLKELEPNWKPVYELVIYNN